MKKAYIIGFMVLLVVSKAQADEQEGAKNWDTWAACTEDIECVAIHDQCGGWTAVNIQYKAQGEEYQEELASMAKCSAVNMEPEPKVLCLGQVCSVKPSILKE